MPMNGMSAGHFVTCRSRGKQVFLTDGTVRHVFSSVAIVIVKQLGVNAHAAIVAVTKVISTAHSTKAAILTVIRVLLIGHPQIANAAMIFSKLNSTRHTLVSVYICITMLDECEQITLSYYIIDILIYILYSILTFSSLVL
jgi:hypothetical protein